MKNIKTILRQGAIGYIALGAAVVAYFAIPYIAEITLKKRMDALGEKTSKIYNTLIESFPESLPSDKVNGENDTGLRFQLEGTEWNYRVRAWNETFPNHLSIREWWPNRSNVKCLEILLLKPNSDIVILNENADTLSGEDMIMHGPDHKGFWKHPQEPYQTLPLDRRQEYAQVYERIIKNLEVKLAKSKK